LVLHIIHHVTFQSWRGRPLLQDVYRGSEKSLAVDETVLVIWRLLGFVCTA
jgi:hypothetical protein